MELTKKCVNHGDLTAEQIGKTVKRGKPYLTCKLCSFKSRQKSMMRNSGKCNTHGQLIPELIKQDGRCKLCHRKNANRKRNENRAWFNAKMKIDREKNPEKWNEIYKQQYLKQRKLYKSDYSLKKCCDRVGITLEKFQEIHDKQKGLCAICHQPEARINGVSKMIGRLVIDHCHTTNKFRGLICHSCNTGLGKFQDDTIRMYRAIRYLKLGGFNSAGS